MTEKIRIVLIENGRGWIIAKMSFPDGLTQFARIEKHADLWLISETEISPEAKDWLVASNKAFLTPGEVRQLRKNKTISFTAAIDPLWEEFLQTKREIYQRLYTPEFFDI